MSWLYIPPPLPKGSSKVIVVHYQPPTPKATPKLLVPVKKDTEEKKEVAKEQNQEEKLFDLKIEFPTPKQKNNFEGFNFENGNLEVPPINWQGQFDPQDVNYENEVNLDLFWEIFEKEDKNFLTLPILDLGNEVSVSSYKQDWFKPKEVNLELHLEEWSPVSRKRNDNWISSLLLGCGGVYIFPKGEEWMFIQCSEGETNQEIRKLVEKTRLELNKSDESSAVSEALLNHVFLWNPKDKEEILVNALEV
ncbi:hypothetical protein [Candidatus Mycoplasma haematohominis]|uniref:Uncharacterized protein n=1 Tax=Candidatus Mycoplasma haematohominis TaxID=1494318 RepID=A0A478FQ26_9MOLU|nr:hypothetical protein [Candidatus Mycoplasma haemohominis]GCE63177.1 hypothetical protein MHSWG343_01550 [Candidatus Mycoplasma haemohominis]